MPRKLPTDTPRTPEQFREHYDLEKVLAAKLRAAGPDTRRGLYSALYDELFRSLPHHPQLTMKEDPAAQEKGLRIWTTFLRRYLNAGSRFLEVGPGDCSVSLELAKHVRDVYAVDVSDEITRQTVVPPNFHLILSDGCTVPVPAESIDVAYSQQLMEHLHPDDAAEQLRNLYRALKPGGLYVCVTPNRLSGPHDISRYYESRASGFHLKEYTLLELTSMFRAVGFRRLELFVVLKGFYPRLPAMPIRVAEAVLDRLPDGVREPIVDLKLVRMLLGINLLAWK